MPLVLIHTDYAQGSAPLQMHIGTEAETRHRSGPRLCHDAGGAGPVPAPVTKTKRGAGTRHLERGILTLAAGIILLALVIGHAMDRLIRNIRESLRRQGRHQSNATNTTIHRGRGNANLYLCKS